MPYSYATGLDLVSRYDARRIADLMSDAGVRLTAADVPANANVLTALYDATAEINSAVLIGKRYTVNDLRLNLTETGYYLLQRLTCDLAMGYLVARRGLDATQSATLAPRADIATQQLQMLKDGIKILDKLTDDIPLAGLASHQPIGPAVINLVTIANPYFGIGPYTVPNPYGVQ